MAAEDHNPELRVEGFTYSDRAEVVPRLSAAIDGAGGWILERKPISATAVELAVESQRGALREIYGALLGAGLELTRSSHRALADSCNCALHLRGSRGLWGVLPLRLTVHFLADPLGAHDPTHLLAIGAALA